MKGGELYVKALDRDAGKNAEVLYYIYHKSKEGDYYFQVPIYWAFTRQVYPGSGPGRAFTRQVYPGSGPGRAFTRQVYPGSGPGRAFTR